MYFITILELPELPMFTSSLLTSVPLGRESALNMLNLLRSMVKKTESSPVNIFLFAFMLNDVIAVLELVS